MSANPIRIDLDLIRTDGGTQSRAFLNQNIINEYAELFDRSDSWAVFLPIRVFYERLKIWWTRGGGVRDFWIIKKKERENNELKKDLNFFRKMLDKIFRSGNLVSNVAAHKTL